MHGWLNLIGNAEVGKRALMDEMRSLTVVEKIVHKVSCPPKTKFFNVIIEQVCMYVY